MRTRAKFPSTYSPSVAPGTAIFAVLDTSASIAPFLCGLGGLTEEMVWTSLFPPQPPRWSSVRGDVEATSTAVFPVSTSAARSMV
jgi:hypothetical protein